MKITTIDIQAKQWFDKVNGNSYFAGNICLNYGMEDEKNVKMNYQYGYGDHYIDVAFDTLENEGIITDREKYSNGSKEQLWKYCNDKKIILRKSKQTGCKKRELLSY